LLVVLLLSATLFSCSHKGGELKGPVALTDRELVDVTLTSDTTLSGEIIIKGSLIVKKSANLTVLPGTVIRFRRFLKDDDDISDSDIVIEGSITAVGTKESPILFTSYEKDKKRADWKFIMVNFARESTFKFCTIEYAYSGVQIHFTRATVENCVFRNNFDGVRFSTAKINVRHNDIYDNVNGIRYEERKAKAIITKNNIHNNKVGIFCVIRSDDMSTITRNNVFANDDYNVKLGLSQDNDVTMKNNYWGAPDEAAIQNSIFDKEFDEQLGKVHFTPYLKDKVPVGADQY
jgi:hypothetical protein